jgi:hypothetical protein
MESVRGDETVIDGVLFSPPLAATVQTLNKQPCYRTQTGVAKTARFWLGARSYWCTYLGYTQTLVRNILTLEWSHRDIDSTDLGSVRVRIRIGATAALTTILTTGSRLHVGLYLHGLASSAVGPGLKDE